MTEHEIWRIARNGRHVYIGFTLTTWNVVGIAIGRRWRLIFRIRLWISLRLPLAGSFALLCSGLPASEHVLSPPVWSSYSTHNIYELFNFYTITQKSNLNCCCSIIPLQRSRNTEKFETFYEIALTFGRRSCCFSSLWSLSSRFRPCCSLGSCRHRLCFHIKIEASKCTKRVRHVQACNDKWLPHKALHMHNSIHDNNSHLPSLLAAFRALFGFGSLSVISLSLSDGVTDVDGTYSLSLFGTMGRFRVPLVCRNSCHSLFMGVDLDFSIRSRNTEQRFVTTNMHGSYELWTK